MSDVYLCRKMRVGTWERDEPEVRHAAAGVPSQEREQMSENAMMNEEQFSRMLEVMATRLQPVIEQKAQQAYRESSRGGARRRAFGGMSGDAMTGLERTRRFFAAVLGGDLVGAKALSEGVSSAGGNLVPTEFRSEIIARLPEEAELAPFVRVVPVRAQSGSIPSLSSDISILWRGGSTSPAENQTFHESEPALGTVSWSLKRADAITRISRELVSDSQPPVIEFITRLFQEAIARERDRMIAVGSGAGATAGTQPVGLENTALPESNILSVGGALTFAKLVSLEHALKRKYRQRARWVMNSNNLHRAFALTDTTGRPLFTREYSAGAPQAMLMGYPVSVQDDLADGNIFFGDLSCYIWFDREEMGIESTSAGGDAFANHQVWVKVWERADGKLAIPEAFVKGTGIVDAE